MVNFTGWANYGGTCTPVIPAYNPILLVELIVRFSKFGRGFHAGVAQWLEHHVANVNVEGSNPFTRSLFFRNFRPRPFPTDRRFRRLALCNWEFIWLQCRSG